MTREDKNLMGNQFIRSIDSIGANIAEGYGRFHYMDKVRFYYMSRGSLLESCTHWLELIKERNRMTLTQYGNMKSTADKLLLMLNKFINSTYRARDSFKIN